MQRPQRGVAKEIVDDKGELKYTEVRFLISKEADFATF